MPCIARVALDAAAAVPAAAVPVKAAPALDNVPTTAGTHIINPYKFVERPLFGPIRFVLLIK